ncbi:DUF4157 domain-containing protein [Streptomyces sp. NPDC001657]|uniref:DUF4157 domain-containing protein n=1 Tax=Streptomyces sp. NPDC001657 TaxID=3154522 RepID=UPI0033331A3A
MSGPERGHQRPRGNDRRTGNRPDPAPGLAAPGDRLASAHATRPMRRPDAPGPARRGTRHPSITDRDAARAALTTRLLARLAGQLGFSAAAAKVVVNGEAARRTAPRGARGLMTDGVIWLHPDRYDPATAAGRGLLAHEATHLAQRMRNPAGARHTTVAEAETEAARAAADFAEGRALSAPAVALPDGAVAADTGMPAGAVTTTKAGPPAADQVAQVHTSYAKDIEVIRARLGWPVGADDVSFALAVLDQYPPQIAVAILRAVGAPFLERLTSHLDDGQRRRHRQSVLACYGALPDQDRRRLDPHLFAGMDLGAVTAAERDLVVDVLRQLGDDSFQELLNGPQRTQVLLIMHAPPPGTEGRSGTEPADAPAPATGSGPPGGDAERARLAASIATLMRASGGLAVHDALLLLRRLLPGPPEDMPPTPTDRPLSGALREVVGTLEDSGTVQRLIKALPEKERDEADPFGQVLLEVIRHRPVAANLAQLQDLLSYGFLGSLTGITGEEAWLAYQIVRRLPAAAQERWLRLDDGKWFRRLEDNIPAGKRDRYEGVVVERSSEGRLADVASQVAEPLTGKEGRDVWTAIVNAAKEGMDEARAPGLLRRIHGAGEQLAPPRRDALRRAVVLRLDQLGWLNTILVRLPDRFLLDLDNLVLVREVVGLRDPAHLRRQIHHLISRNFWSRIPVIGRFFSPWSVSAHEAFVAFQLARMLPEADREELAAGGRWAAMVDALTEEMRQAAGTHLFSDRDGREREGLMGRLRDDRLWAPDRAAELRILVRMAVELGLRRFLFDRSREVRAFARPELAPMVEEFQLYAEPHRTRYAPTVLKTEAPRGVWGAIHHTAGWLWVKVAWLGRILHGARLSEEVVGLENMELDGGRLTLLYERKTGLLRIDLTGKLELGPFDHLGAGLGLRVGRITLSGIHGVASFPPQVTAPPGAVRLTLRRAEMADLLATGDDLLLGVSRAVASALDLHLSTTGAEEPVPQPPESGFGLPIPLVGWLLRFLYAAVEYVSKPVSPLSLLLQGLEVSVGSITFEGLARGSGLTAHSARIENLLVGIGLNRPAYLRALRTVLQRRLAREGNSSANAPARQAIEQQLAKVEDSLADIAEHEKRLAGLREIYVRAPGGLTDPQRREAAGLERELSGGAVVDADRIALEGLDGDLRAKEVSLSGVGGEVAGPAFTPDTLLSSAFVTDADRIAEFRKRDMRAPGAGGGGAAMALPLRVEKAVATEVAYLGDIPSAASLRKELDGLPPATPAARRKELQVLADRVSGHEALDQRARGQLPPPLTPEERLAFDRERDALRTVFGFRAKTVEAHGVGSDLLLGPSLTEAALHGARADSVTATEVTYGGFFSAEKIHGRKLGGASAPRAPHALDRQTYTFHADEFTARGAVVDWAGNRAAEVGISGLAGEFELQHDRAGGALGALGVPRLTAAAATVAGIDYRTARAWVHSQGITRITGLSLEGRAVRRRVGAASGWAVHVSRLHLDRVSADRLTFESDESGAPYRVEITSGSLLGITVQDVDFLVGAEEPPKRVLPGLLELGGLDRLRFEVVMGALGGGSATLSSVTPEGSPRVTGTLVARAGADAESGGDQIELNGIQLTQGAEEGIHTRSGRLSITRLLLGHASVVHTGDVWTVRALQFPEIRLGGLNWRTADDAQLQSTGPTVLHDVHVNGELTTAKDRPMRVHVDHLGVGSVTAAQLAYHHGALHLELGRRPGTTQQRGRPPLEIHDIALRDFDWTAERGANAGTLTVASAEMEFHGQLAAHLLAEATVRATSLAATFRSHGRLALRVRGAVDAGLAWAEPGATGAAESVQEAEAHVLVGGLDTGVIDIGPESITFGPDEEPGLRIHDLTVDQIHYRSEDLLLDSLPGGHGVTLRRVGAKLRVELRTAAERAAAGRGASAVRRIVLHEIGVERLEADGIKVTLPHVVAPDLTGQSRPVEIWLDPGEPGVVQGARLVLPAAGVALAAPTSPAAGWSIPELQLQIGGATDPVTGARTADALLIPALRVRVAGILQEARAMATVERIDVRYLSGGGVVADLRHPSLSAIEAVFRGAPRHRLRIAGIPGSQRPQAGGIRAEQMQIDTRTGRLTLTDLQASHLRYENAEAGAEVTVDRVTALDKTEVVLPGKDRSAGVALRELEIQDAWFDAELGGGPPAPQERLPWTALLKRLGPYQEVFDSLQGRIRMTVHQPESLLFRISDTPVDLSVVDGRLEYRTIERQIIGGARAVLNFTLHREPPQLELGVAVPTGTGSARMRLAVWDLDRSELRQADATEQVRIWRLLQVEGRARGKLDNEDELRAEEERLRKEELHKREALRNLEKLSKEERLRKEEELRRRDELRKEVEFLKSGTSRGGASPVELHDIDMTVSVRSTHPIPVDLSQASDGKIGGTVTLAREALAGLQLKGTLPLGAGLRQVELAQAKFEAVEIRLPGGQEARTGEIVIDRLRDIALQLSPGWSPRRISGRIEHAVARNIVWRAP